LKQGAVDLSNHATSWAMEAASTVGNRVDDPLQKVGSSLPLVACKNIAIPLLESGMDAGVVKGCLVMR